jgi:hypothetical protein
MGSGSIPSSMFIRNPLTGYTKHFAYVWHPLIQNFVARVAVQPLKKLLACSFLILTKA